MTISTYLETHVDLEVAEGVDPGEVFLALADAFHELPSRVSRDIAFDASVCALTLSYTFEGPISPDEAIREALIIGRTAFQAAGLGTGNDTWDLARWTIVPSIPERAAQLA